MNSLTEIFSYVPYGSEALRALMPIIVLGIGATLCLVMAPIKNLGANLSKYAAMATILISSLSMLTMEVPPQQVGGVLFLGMHSSILFLALHVIALITIVMLNVKNDGHGLLPEAYALVVYTLAGMCLLVGSNHLLFQFIGIEIMSLGVYVLVAMRRSHRESAEAGMKYFILGGLASATFLYGSALLYGTSGSFIHDVVASAAPSPLKTIGFVLVVGGLLFKVGAVPFHAWVPDVYQGASMPVTAYMASAVKFTSFIVLASIATKALQQEDLHSIITIILGVSALATMIWGNFAALQQKSIKRLLAYSSIAHTGYLLVGVLGGAIVDVQNIALYLSFYGIATLGAFACVNVLLGKDADFSIESLGQKGMQQPLMGFALTVFLLAMAGIPVTAGFIGKYLLFSSAVAAGQVPLVICAVLVSAVAIYYYLRLIVVMYMSNAVEGNENVVPPSIALQVVVMVCLIATIYFGIIPTGIIALFRIV